MSDPDTKHMTDGTEAFPLGSLHMTGSYPLSDRSIDREVERTSPGNYALGYLEGETFLVFYVGRSDSDVNRALHEWVGKPSPFDRYASMAKAPWDLRRGGGLPLGVPALACVGNGVDTSYTRFAFSYASSPEAAFERECHNYDDFGRSIGLDNRTQPVPPAEEDCRAGRHDAGDLGVKPPGESLEQILLDLANRFETVGRGRIRSEIDRGLQRVARFLGAGSYALLEPRRDLNASWALRFCSPKDPRLLDVSSERFLWDLHEAQSGGLIVRLGAPDPRPAPSQEVPGPRSCFIESMVVPICLGHRTVGVVSFGPSVPRHARSSDLLDQLRTIAAVFAQGLHRIRVEEQLDDSRNWSMSGQS